MEIDFPPMNNRIYKVKYVWDNDPYWDEGLHLWPRCRPRYDSNWKRRKQLFSYQIRMYRTWKYNRNSQWKSE